MGSGVSIQPPARIENPRTVTVGSGTYIGPNCWIQGASSGSDATLVIGARCSFSGDATVSAALSVSIGDDVLVARGVFICDHSHETSARGIPIKDQGSTEPKPVHVGDGAWIGQGAVILPGVTIGRCAVIGAYAVVGIDVPDGRTAVGIPARLLG
ncbi:DapH/DapD/GlmU-related protein [Nocardioides zeae]|uniref:acyltransferase n=1 Tax=Nocardioides zeae TaxID=1457234 RepID=UPI00286A87E1|nr:DapH/DapD/GlmU-related protein [Nocardioides zeae]